MKKSFYMLLLVLYVTSHGFISSGCALFLLGTGAAGGYAAIGEDELEAMLDKKYDSVWKASEEVMREQGLTLLADKGQGNIEGEVEGSKVRINVEQMTPKTVRLRVKARKVKNLFPDMKRAEKMYNLIMRKIG